MKNIQLALLFIICITKGYGQTSYSYGHLLVEITKQKKTISAKVKLVLDFTNEDSSWVRVIENDINKSLQQVKRVKKGKYIVSVKFIRTRDGSLSDIRCENDRGSVMCEEVLRVFKKSRKWVPAAQPTNKIPN